MANLIISNHPIALANGTYIDQGQVGDSRTWTKAAPPEWVDVTEFVIEYIINTEQWRLFGSEEDDSESVTPWGETELGYPSSTPPWEIDWFFSGELFDVDEVIEGASPIMIGVRRASEHLRLRLLGNI